MHYNEEKRKYIAVRLASGGGTREVHLSLDSSAGDIVMEAVKLFYPNGKSLNHGMASSMKLQLGNFKGEVVDDKLKADRNSEPFTLRKYIETNKLSRVRLYLMSKPENEDGEFLDESSDEDLEYSPFDTDKSEQQSSNICGDMSAASLPECTVGKAKVDADEDLPSNEHSSSIQAVRASRVLPEPDFTTTDAVIVAVRHVDKGVITRFFRCNEAITAVYDWVGSLQAEPVHFELCNALSPDRPLDPSNSVRTVEKTMLIMQPSTNGPHLMPDEPEISMSGFRSTNDFDIVDITPLPRARSWLKSQRKCKSQWPFSCYISIKKR